MPDTRRISYSSPYATAEQRKKRLLGLGGGFLQGITELPLDVATALAPGAGYTPGELRSSPKDKLRAQQYEIERFMRQMGRDPDFAKGAQLGYGASMVFDPVVDVGLAAGPATYKGLKGLARLAEKGELATEIGKAGQVGRRVAESQRGAVGDVEQEVGESLAGKAAETPEEKLIAQHNIRPGGVLHAEKMGGLPAPSLAVTKETTPLQGFGEITLLGDEGMIDPRASGSPKTFGADIYSPRYPKVEYTTSQKRINDINKSLIRNEEKIGAWDSDIIDPSDFKTRGAKSVEDNPLVMADFIEKQGMDIPVVKEDGEVDRWDTMSEMRDVIQKDPELQSKYLDHVATITDDLKESERLFLGFTNSGRRKYAPHTLDNVVKEMRREMRGGEGFNYGVGSIRAKYTPQFRSVKKIRENKGRLVSKQDFETVKNEVDAEFEELFENYYDHMKNKPDGFGAMDVFTAHLEEAADRGVGEVLNEYYKKGTDPEPLKKFLQKLKNLPTEYFEAKFTRPVDVGEFKAAIVPEGTSKKVIDSLKKRGIKRIEKYKKGDYEDRKKAIGKFKDLMFSAAPFGVLMGAREQRDSEIQQAEFQDLQRRLNNLRATGA